jgi:SAM-dependent methyltransferase
MPSRSAYLRRARHWIANRGWRGFFEQALWRLELKLKGKPMPGRAGPEKGPHPFDREYGVDTTGLIWGEALETSSPEASYWATGYYGIAPSAFNTALDRLALDWARFTFVDVGCGKGRALLLATRFPFRSLLGIELSPALAAVAQRNLELFRAPWKQPNVDATVIAADATTVALPSGPLLLFLYHPFAAPVMRRFLTHLLTSTGLPGQPPREVYLLYTNPELAALLDATGGLTRLWSQSVVLAPEETAADRFNSTEEHTVAYRLHP